VLKEKKKKNQIQASESKEKKEKKKRKGKCELMEASIMRLHEPWEAVTVTARTYCRENSLLESMRGDSGRGLGYAGMVGQLQGLFWPPVQSCALDTQFSSPASSPRPQRRRRSDCKGSAGVLGPLNAD